MILTLPIEPKFKRKIRDKILFYLSISLILFGAFNIANSYAANEIQNETQNEIQNKKTSPNSDAELSFQEQIIFALIEKGLSQVGPIVGGAVGLGIQFARKKGLQISAEAEEYTVKLASSFVASQSRWIYEQSRNKGYWEEKDKKYKKELEEKLEKAKKEHLQEDVKNYEKDLEKVNRQHILPYTLGKAARDRAIADLKVELKSDEFTKTTRKMLEDNLVSLVERTVTQNNKEMTEKCRKIIHDLAPLAIESLLLPLKSKEDAQKTEKKIIKDAIASIRKHFDFEEIPFDENYLDIVVKAELNKRIGNITTPQPNTQNTS